MDARERVRRAASTAVQAVLIPAVACGLLACTPAPAQEVPRSPQTGSKSTAQSGADSAGAKDDVARALDRIDAARARLQAADAVVTSAMRDLDAALASASQLGPSRPGSELSSATERIEREADGMTARWRNRERWQEVGSHWSDFGQRIAAHAERFARAEAAVAEREAEREAGRDAEREADREMRRALHEHGRRDREWPHNHDEDDDDDQ